MMLCHRMSVPDMEDKACRVGLVSFVGDADVSDLAECDPLAVGRPDTACYSTVPDGVLHDERRLGRLVRYPPYLHLGAPHGDYATIYRRDCNSVKAIMSDPLMANGSPLEVPQDYRAVIG